MDEGDATVAIRALRATEGAAAKPGGRCLYVVSRAMLRAVARVAFRLTVRGAEHVPVRGACILAPNHVSYLDSVILGCASPRMLRFMAEVDIFQHRFSARLLDRLGAFPVRRGLADRAAIRTALGCLFRGEALAVFPEGGRGSGEGVGPLLPGVGLLAERSGVAVIPTGIRGTLHAWPRQRSLPRPAPVMVVFGRPLSFAEETGGTSGQGARRRFIARLQVRIEELLVE